MMIDVRRTINGHTWEIGHMYAGKGVWYVCTYLDTYTVFDSRRVTSCELTRTMEDMWDRIIQACL